MSRAAFASVLMGPRALGASLVAARCAASSPASAATAAVTAYGEDNHTRFFSSWFLWIGRLACRLRLIFSQPVGIQFKLLAV